MNVNRFECANEHIFFIPLYLPQSTKVFVEFIQQLKCPTCGIDASEIKMSGQEYTIK